MDLLHHPSIAWDGRVYLCNRLDTEDKGLIGDLTTHTLDEIWQGPARAAVLDRHIQGHRLAVPACAGCQYYGIPASTAARERPQELPMLGSLETRASLVVA